MPRTFRVLQSTKRRDSINQPLTLFLPSSFSLSHSLFPFLSRIFSFPSFTAFLQNPTLFLPFFLHISFLFLSIKLPVKSSYFSFFPVLRSVWSSLYVSIFYEEVTILLILLHTFANPWIHSYYSSNSCVELEILFVLSLTPFVLTKDIDFATILLRLSFFSSDFLFWSQSSYSLFYINLNPFIIVTNLLVMTSFLMFFRILVQHSNPFWLVI